MPTHGLPDDGEQRELISRRRMMMAMGGSAGLIAGCAGDGGDGDGDGNGSDGDDGDGGTDGEKLDVTLRSAIQFPPDELELNQWARNYNSPSELSARVAAWSNHLGKYFAIDAKNFGVDLENDEFRVELQEDLYWHQQGEEIDPVTAEDLVKQKQFERRMVPEDARSKTAVDEWTTDGENTVVAKLQSNFNDELVLLEHAPTTVNYYRDGKLLGEKLQELEDATSADEKKQIRSSVTDLSLRFGDKPLSGPWTHVETAGDTIRFELFEKHWNADNINFKRWSHTNFGSGSTGEKKIYQGYVNDELDFQNQGWQMQKPAAVPFSNIPDHIEFLTYIGNHTDALIINYRQPWADPMFSRESLPNPSAQVRQGMAYALDPETAMTNHYGKNPQFQEPGKPTGMGRLIAEDTLGEETYGQLPSYYEQDLEKAAEKFREAGLSKEKGNWVKSNGKPLTLKVEILPWYDTALNTLTGNLENFGVAVERVTGEETKLANSFWGTREYGSFIVNYGRDASASQSLLMNLYNGPPETGSGNMNRAGIPAEIKVPPFGELDGEPTETVNLKQYWDEIRTMAIDELMDKWAKKLAWVYAYHLPAIPLVGVANGQMINTNHFEWPDRPDVSQGDVPHAAIVNDEKYPPCWSAGRARFFLARGQDGAGNPGPVAKDN